MKLTAKERRAMLAMMELAQAKLNLMPETHLLNSEEKAVVNRLCDVRNGLREVLLLALA